MKKIYKKILLGLALIPGIGMNAQEITSSFHSGVVNTFSKPNLDCSTTIPPYENIDDSQNGYSSQIFEPANEAYNNELADDFVAPAGVGSICSVSLLGSFSAGGGFSLDPDSQVILNVYADDGGMPGTLLFTESFDPNAVVDGAGAIALPVTVAHSINPGESYWVAVQAKLAFALGGQWYWNTSMTQIGQQFAWRNPGDGFGTGCTDWGNGMDCLGATEPDAFMVVEFADPLGTSEIGVANIQLYPNPATNVLNIPVPNGETILQVKATDMSGTAIQLKLNKDAANVSALPKGDYIITIKTNKRTYNQKMIKK